MLHRSWNVFLNVLEAPNVDKELVDKERLSAVCPCHCVAICVAWARRVHPDCGGSADDGGRLDAPAHLPHGEADACRGSRGPWVM